MKLWTSSEVNLTLTFFPHKCHCIKSFPGDLDDDIEFDDVDSEGSGSDEGDDIDGI